jgi:hypothetical protein
MTAQRHYARAADLYRRAGHLEDARRVEAARTGSAEGGPAETDEDGLLPQSPEFRRLAELLTPGEAPPDPGLVGSAFREADVLALGHPRDGGTESDLLHFTMDMEDGSEQTYLPVFTRIEPMQDALLRNPEWQELSVLEVNGGALLDNIDSDVRVVINPWGPDEFVLPD